MPLPAKCPADQEANAKEAAKALRCSFPDGFSTQSDQDDTLGDLLLGWHWATINSLLL